MDPESFAADASYAAAEAWAYVTEYQARVANFVAYVEQARRSADLAIFTAQVLRPGDVKMQEKVNVLTPRWSL